MKYRFSIVLLLLALASTAALGQARSRYTTRQRKADSKVEQYSDSLRHYADSLYRDSVTVPPVVKDADMARLFLPLTFYRQEAHRAFSLSDSLTTIDNHLLSMYLHRPDLITTTQRQLEKTGGIIAPKTVTEKPTATVTKVAPEEAMPVPVDIVVLKPNFWDFGGDYYLQFLQNYVSSNWYQGGESNYSMVGALTLQANYNNKQEVKWENKLEMKLGMQTTKDDSLHSVKSSQDLLRYTGKLGLQATKKWYYTFQLIAYTQFVRNYKSNQDVVQSDFMSPFNLNLSVGMDYNVDWLKHRLKGSVHLAPFAFNLKYVGRLGLATRYGLKEGHHTLDDYGSQLTLDLKWKLMENLLWQTRLYGYTTYKRAEMEWENTFTFQFNRYLSTKLFVYPRFDDGAKRDDHHGYWQFKEFVSLGFSYSF